jgi:glycine cleavage system H protein
MDTQNMKFVTTHEWIRLENEDEASIGISHHAQQLLGDLVYVELPKIGQDIVAGAAVGVVESVKAASDLYAPATGKIIAVNQEVVADPTLINQDPYGKGWLFKVKLNEVKDLDALLSAAKYQSMHA